jgi:hypothetical protein
MLPDPPEGHWCIQARVGHGRSLRAIPARRAGGRGTLEIHKPGQYGWERLTSQTTHYIHLVPGLIRFALDNAEHIRNRSVRHSGHRFGRWFGAQWDGRIWTIRRDFMATCNEHWFVEMAFR